MSCFWLADRGYDARNVGNLTKNAVLPMAFVERGAGSLKRK